EHQVTGRLFPPPTRGLGPSGLDGEDGAGRLEKDALGTGPEDQLAHRTASPQPDDDGLGVVLGRGTDEVLGEVAGARHDPVLDPRARQPRLERLELLCRRCRAGRHDHGARPALLRLRDRGAERLLALGRSQMSHDDRHGGTLPDTTSPTPAHPGRPGHPLDEAARTHPGGSAVEMTQCRSCARRYDSSASRASPTRYEARGPSPAHHARNARSVSAGARRRCGTWASTCSSTARARATTSGSGTTASAGSMTRPSTRAVASSTVARSASPVVARTASSP